MTEEKVTFIFPTKSAKWMAGFGPIFEEDDMGLKFYDDMEDDEFGLIIGDSQFLFSFGNEDKQERKSDV